MASAIRMYKEGLMNADLGYGPGLGKALVGAGVEFGAGFALGEVYHRHQDKWIGRHAGAVAGIVGKAGAVILQAFAGGEAHMLSGMLNSVGAAGVAMTGCEMGLRHARSATGKRVVMLPKDAALPANAREVSIGALPPAQPGGKSLTWDQIEELANMH